ncbi:MAG: Gfo/Idh/MocA family oxidoreductase [Bacteroidales bacterium]|nr:Gfo/Idh/MocA family oxidoreductase [Bacteroidales bacterium]
MRKIKTGIASFGMSGRVFHAPLLHANPAFELSAICERSKNEASALYPTIKTVNSFAELISIEEIELIIVNTPDTTHYEFCKVALLANKHVVVEKPFVFTVKEGEELISLSKRQNKLLTIFQNRRWDGDFLTVQKIINETRLGRIVEFQSSMQRYRNFVVPNTWKEEANRHVGLTYNLGSHLIDQAIVLFGMPSGIFAQIEKLRDNSQIDDYFQIQLMYPKLVVTLRAGYLMREETPRYTLHGTMGSYVKYGLDPQEEQLKNGTIPVGENWGANDETKWGILHTEENGKIVRQSLKTENGNYNEFYNQVAECILNDAKSPIDATENLKLIAILEAAFLNHEQNRVIFL